MESLYSIAERKILEDISVSWAGGNKYATYLNLIKTKFKFKSVVEKVSKLDKKVYLLKFGPSVLPDISGKYVYLVIDERKSSKGKRGRITHFVSTKSDFNDLKSVDTNNIISEDGISFFKVPKDFTSINHVMALVLGVGKNDLKGDKNKFLAASAEIDASLSRHSLSVSEKWELAIITLKIVFDGNTSGVVITGSPGMGKTFTIFQTLNALGKKKDVDYHYVQGAKITVSAFYAMLYEHSDKLLIFDDSDSVFNNADGINMMKAALDTTGERVLTYDSPYVDKLGIPKSFRFTGKMVFISNLSMSDVDSALRSRSLVMDLHMTRAEKLQDISDKFASVSNGVNSSLTLEEKTFIKDFLIDFASDAGNGGFPKQIDFRTLVKLYDIYDGVKSSHRDFSSKEIETLFVKLARNQMFMS